MAKKTLTLALITRTDTVIGGGGVDTPYPAPHNVVLTPSDHKLYVTHSAAMSDKVTIYKVSPRTGAPVFNGEVTVELNPFGIAYIE